MRGTGAAVLRANAKYRHRLTGLIAALAIGICASLAFAGSASATVTLGVGWSGALGWSEPEMPLVAKAGASTFRIPMSPSNNHDGLVKAAAEEGVTIHAEVSAEVFPTGEARTNFIADVKKEVERYGYEGSFWGENPKLPYRPITTWEVWNEPNKAGIGPENYGTFVGEVATAIQNASENKAKGQRTEVLSAGLLALGNKGAAGKPTTYNGALEYLELAYPKFATNADVTGIAIHPYELDQSTFFQPPEGPQYTRSQAFEYAVKGFRTKLNELRKNHGGPTRSLWITEAGWPAETAGKEVQFQVTESQQAALLADAYEFTKKEEVNLNIKDFLWYNFRDRPDESADWANWCGLRAHDGHFRNAWTTFQAKAGVPQVIPSVPGVITGSATEVQPLDATLNGAVNPHELPTSYAFEYGTTTSYGKTVSSAPGAAGRGGTYVNESVTIHNLRPGTKYHYRMVSSNVVGTNYGADVEFETPPVVAFQSAVGELWTTPVPNKAVNQHLGMGAEGSRASVAPMTGGGYVAAFRDTGNELWTYSSGTGATNLHLGMMAGSTPSIAALPGNGYVIAFQSPAGELWIYSSYLGAVNLHQGMGFSASSPSIAVLSDGNYVVAFRAFGNVLAAYSSKTGPISIGAAMKEGASPSIAAETGATFEIAFQSAAGQLNAYSPAAGVVNLGLAMGSEPSTPSMTELSGGGMQIAFRSAAGELWTYSSFSGATNLHLGMGLTPTAPSIVAIPGGGYEIAFKATNDELWTYNSFSGGNNMDLSMRSGSSPSIAITNDGGHVVAFQSAVGELWTTPVPNGATNQHFGMGTEASRASVTALTDGGYEAAFRDFGNELWTYSPSAGGANTGLGMMAGSTPDIAPLPGGGYVVAFQSPAGELWVYSSVTGAENLHQGMGFSASSPSIAVRPDGSYVVAFRAFGNVLQAYSSTSGPVTIGAPMLAGASPDIAPLQSGEIEIAFQSSAGELNTYSSVSGLENLHLGMGFEASTPSIVELAGGGWQIAFRAIGGELWTYSSFSGATNLHFGMGSTPTAPSIVALPGGGYEIAFKATGDELWTYNSFTGPNNMDLLMRAGSSPSIAR